MADRHVRTRGTDWVRFVAINTGKPNREFVNAPVKEVAGALVKCEQMVLVWVVFFLTRSGSQRRRKAGQVCRPIDE